MSDSNSPEFKPREALALSMPQREAVIERLTRSFAEDAITMDEFERRAELAYRAVSMADLQVLVSDLPVDSAPAGGSVSHGKGQSRVATGDRIRTLLGSTERGMPGIMPRFLRVRTMLGNTELDFRQSTFEPGVTEVNVRCLMGNVELTVPDGVRVEIFCTSVLANVGFNDHRARDGSDDSIPLRDGGNANSGSTSGVNTGSAMSSERVLRITGRAIFANVEVHRGSLRREP
ncbi:MAG: DUF1707 and DUF2154 domain-containing protein [Phycisphaerae bacterium]|nr:DUF1707 and DUF2154 domain-containing protein [Gemmatimonadaceae bacterium]